MRIFGFVFPVNLAGLTKLFFVIVSEISFLHLTSRLSTTFLYRCWLRSGIESTKACTAVNESSKNELIGKKSSKHGNIMFPKHVCSIILLVVGVILIDTFKYFALHLFYILDKFGSCDLPRFCNLSLVQYEKSFGRLIELIVLLLCSWIWS